MSTVPVYTMMFSFVGDEVLQRRCRLQGRLGLALLGLPRGGQEAWKLWDWLQLARTFFRADQPFRLAGWFRNKADEILGDVKDPDTPHVVECVPADGILPQAETPARPVEPGHRLTGVRR